MIKKRFTMRYFTALLYASSLFGAQSIFASGFQLWEQDGASVGNYHAGYAAEANDASTAFYNPAGITRFKNQQVVMSGMAVFTNIKYKGTVAVNNVLNNAPQNATAQGGGFALVPNLNYVAPINDKLGFGFSITVPFAAQVNYGRDTFLRYASTLSSVKVIDMSPSLGMKLTDKTSVGFGIDLQRMEVEFDQIAGLGPTTNDTDSTNRANDTGWGAHFGGLYEFTPDSRVGFSYHSQVVHHLSRKSSLSGPLAGTSNIVSRATANITLPPYTALSLFQRINPKVAVMGSVIYTQWTNVRDILMKNISAVDAAGLPETIDVDIPEHFKNTWNVSIGADYSITDQFTLKSGIGYDQTPVQNAYRTVQLPDNDRYVVALGGHYQASKTVGVDLGWSHFFMNKAHIAPPTQVTGSQRTTTSGSVTGQADVYSAQLTWDIL